MSDRDPLRANMEVEINNAEYAKEAILERMVSDGYIVPEKAKEFAENYALIFIKDSWYPRVYKEPEDKWIMRCSKIK